MLIVSLVVAIAEMPANAGVGVLIAGYGGGGSPEPDGGAFSFWELFAGGNNPSEFCVRCFMGKVISFF
jgi:hypothetical protein